MLLQASPTMFNRIVFAVIRGIVGQVQRDLVLGHKVYEALKKLRAPTVILRPIIHIQDQGGHQREAQVQGGLPQIFQAIEALVHKSKRRRELFGKLQGLCHFVALRHSQVRHFVQGGASD